MKTKRIMYAFILGVVLILLVGGTWLLLRPGPSAMDYVPSATSLIASADEYWPTEGWRTSTPEEQGFDSAKLAKDLQTLHKRNYAIDSLLIIRNGRVILDAYFYPYNDSFPHDLASVTKSFTTTLIAIAAGQGKIDLDQPMISYFPDRKIANPDERKQAVTVRNLAGMVNGMESGCLSGDEPTLNAMRSQDDWVQAALDRKMAQEPGKHFCYDSPGMHLLSAILQKTTGITELEFARQSLFEPLGIREVYWESDPQGYTHGWGDLHLKPRDAAKLGYLWLHQGVWQGKQIVPVAWVMDAVKVHSKIGVSDNYGYGWWVSDNSYSGMGRGGQNIKVYPALNMIVVTTAGGFDYAVLDRMLEDAFQDPEEPLPANPEGVAKLKAQLAEISQGPGSEPLTSLPEVARTISGKTYHCEANDAGVASLRFEFNDLRTASMYMEQNGQDVVWPIGLDGQYRISPEGQGVQGQWKNDQTFVLKIFDIGRLTREIMFETGSLTVTIPEVDMTIKCQAQNP
jgi:CubicO group peptidase (beta-lactamase class C family)